MIGERILIKRDIRSRTKGLEYARANDYVVVFDKHDHVLFVQNERTNEKFPIGERFFKDENFTVETPIPAKPVKKTYRKKSAY